MTPEAASDTPERLAAAWQKLAGGYAVIRPGLMVFEALNEPTIQPPERWQAAQRSVLEHIRTVAPHHTVLLTASPDSTAFALAALTPVEDQNVAYVFHFYTPNPV